MSKIIKLQQAKAQIVKFHKSNKSIVLVGGCFDILHIGHIHFFKRAKKMGNILVVLLESDEKVKKLKGSNRPFHNQQARAEILASLQYVDSIILLPTLKKDSEYNALIFDLKPDIVAVTENDPLLDKKEKQIQSIGGSVKIIPYRKTLSTSKLAQLLGID